MINGYTSTVSLQFREMLCGCVFVASGKQTIASGATVDVHIKTGSADVVVLNADIDAIGAEFDVFGYSDSTVTSDGTPMPMSCMNRQMDCSPMVALYTSPTVSAVGTQVLQSTIFASSQGSKQSLASGETGHMFLLKKNSNNILRMTNVDTVSGKVAFKMALMEGEL